MQVKIKHLVSEIRQGNAAALARAITMVENELAGFEEILLSAGNSGTGVVGITGPPGAGKSTLVNALLKHWTATGKKTAVIAVDPSSPFNYGALLGDRIRMSEFYNHPGVFIRSLASRGALGGLSAKILEITEVVKLAPFDHILIETVGVGQSEVEIAGLADCTVVVLVPEAGDEVQTLKAGIMEIADIFVVNKADREAADRFCKNLILMVHERHAGKNIPVIKTVATAQEGIEALAAAIDSVIRDKSGPSGKQLSMLTEKCWQIIQADRMKDMNRAQLAADLQASLGKGDFNLYGFTQRYRNTQ